MLFLAVCYIFQNSIRFMMTMVWKYRIPQGMSKSYSRLLLNCGLGRGGGIIFSGWGGMYSNSDFNHPYPRVQKGRIDRVNERIICIAEKYWCCGRCICFQGEGTPAPARHPPKHTPNFVAQIFATAATLLSDVGKILPPPPPRKSSIHTRFPNHLGHEMFYSRDN